MAVPTIAILSKISLNFEPAKNNQFGPKSKICFSQLKELGPKINVAEPLVLSKLKFDGPKKFPLF